LRIFILSYVGEVRDRYLAFGKGGDDFQFASDSFDLGTETGDIHVGPLLS